MYDIIEVEIHLEFAFQVKGCRVLVFGVLLFYAFSKHCSADFFFLWRCAVIFRSSSYIFLAMWRQRGVMKTYTRVAMWYNQFYILTTLQILYVEIVITYWNIIWYLCEKEQAYRHISTYRCSRGLLMLLTFKIINW